MAASRPRSFPGGETRGRRPTCTWRWIQRSPETSPLRFSVRQRKPSVSPAGPRRRPPPRAGSALHPGAGAARARFPMRHRAYPGPHAGDVRRDGRGLCASLSQSKSAASRVPPRQKVSPGVIPRGADSQAQEWFVHECRRLQRLPGCFIVQPARRSLRSSPYTSGNNSSVVPGPSGCESGSSPRVRIESTIGTFPRLISIGGPYLQPLTCIGYIPVRNNLACLDFQTGDSMATAAPGMTATPNIASSPPSCPRHGKLFSHLRQRCAVRVNLPNRFNDVIHVPAVGQEQILGRSRPSSRRPAGCLSVRGSSHATPSAARR